MTAEAQRRLSPLGWAAVGASVSAALVVLSFVTVKMAAPAPSETAAVAPEQPDLGPLGVFQNSIDDICSAILKDRTDLMDQCRDEEQVSMEFVRSYLQANGLLNDDGTIDLLQLSEVAADPLSVVDDDPATVVSYCFQSSPDWVSIGDCINVLDQNAAFTALQPDAGLGGLPGGDGSFGPGQ